jgi:CubicO group peptidase (beta-lactamase class C family)
MSANRGVGHFGQPRARLPLSLRPWLLALAAAQYLASAASAAPAAPPPPAAPAVESPAALASPDAAPAQSYLERLAALSGSPGVSAAVMVDGTLVFSGGVGVANLESREPQTGSTVHNIGSISKTLSVVAVMQLSERGKVRLDAEIQDYAPWFPRKSQAITVRQLLTHTSGIRHYKAGEFGPAEVNSFRHYDSFEESTRYWRDDPLLFAPGTQFAYSSYAVDLLQAVVESASAQSFESYFTEHIWVPAGMVQSQLDSPSRIVPHRGHGYVWNATLNRMENARDEDVSYKYAGGGMLASDEDLVRFGHALNTGVLLRPETLAEMYRLQLPLSLPRFDSDDKSQPPIGATQALIFRVGKDAGGHVYAEHSGSVKGTLSDFLNFYADDVVVALHFNYGAGPVDAEAAAKALAALYLPRKAASSSPARSLPSHAAH